MDIPPYKVPEKKYSTDTIHKTCKLLEDPKYSHQYISEKTGVSINTIKDIMKKTSYKNISDMYNIKPRINKGEFSPISKYTSDQIHNVCKMLELGNVPVKEISNKTGVGLSIVYDIKRGTKWKSISDNYKIK